MALGLPWLKSLLPSLGGAVLFYSRCPLPANWPVTFERIARWSPLVGLALGAGLTLGLSLLDLGGCPPEIRAVFAVAFWVISTGGLHLDGLADTADGLQIKDPQRRLEVMRDSLTGAYGAMAIALTLWAKGMALLALFNLPGAWGWLLTLTWGWARWGQVGAIAWFPYLRTEGKGLIHRRTLEVPEDLLWGLGFLALTTLLWGILQPGDWELLLGATILGLGIPPGIALGLAWRLGGHTGDSYGAVVEIAEAVLLSLYGWLLASF
ncbi:MAG: adenosylcobinamide-GDP ribazoletransferase [Cyanobacteriota bacterium]|jgi:adenosylcobinamide-GDP ribazoletransferase